MALTPLQQARRSRFQTQTATDYDLVLKRLAAAYDPPQGLTPDGAAPTAEGAFSIGGAPRTSGTRVSLRGIPGLTVDEPTAESFTDAAVRNVLQEALAEPSLGIHSLGISDALRDPDASYGAQGSRHKAGTAVDISLVNGRAATLNNPDAVRLARWLLARGFGPSEPRGKPGMIFGPIGHAWNATSFDHRTHIHLSVP